MYSKNNVGLCYQTTPFDLVFYRVYELVKICVLLHSAEKLVVRRCVKHKRVGLVVL